MLYANYLAKIFFSSAANLWSFCICFALKRTWCKCNQHIKVHLSLEDRQQGGRLSHPAIYQVTLEQFIHVEFVVVVVIIIIILPSFPAPLPKFPASPKALRETPQG